MARFPKGTTGAQLDAFARRALWQDGLDYDHGTGHGVGSYLVGARGAAAHLEGAEHPAAAARDDRLERARLLQDRRLRHPHREPRGGAAWEGAPKGDAEREILGFETLTLAPIDRKLIDLDLLDRG